MYVTDSIFFIIVALTVVSFGVFPQIFKKKSTIKKKSVRLCLGLLVGVIVSMILVLFDVFIVKRLFDMMNFGIVNSAAIITHSRASNSQKNFELENTNNGYIINDKYAKHIRASYLYDLKNYDELLNYIKEINIGNDYFQKVVSDLKLWQEAFKA